MKHQIFISSYAKDFPWLLHNLASLKKFCVGFLDPVVCVDTSEESACREIARQSYPEAIIATYSGPPGRDGFMRAQIGMMNCDRLCPGADFIHLIGSDCLAIREYRPEVFFDKDWKPVMLYNSYAALPVGPQMWRRGTTRVLGFNPEFEFMRRLPIVYPRTLYPLVRAHVEKLHHMPFADYIYLGQRGNRDTSESNILGAYAWEFCREMFAWVNLDAPGAYDKLAIEWPNPVAQFWSHGGMDRPTDLDVAYCGDRTIGKTPRLIIDQTMGRAPV